jgi:hypothetical protein
MHGQAEELARFTKRVGKVGSTKAWANRAGKDQARRLLQRAASKGEKFVGSESLARFKQRHGCSSSRSCSRSRSHSPTAAALLARSAATAAAAATAETTASTTTAAAAQPAAAATARTTASLEWQNFWGGRTSGVAKVADLLEWKKSQGVTHTGRTMMASTPGSQFHELASEQPAAANRRSPSSSLRWSSISNWSISPLRESPSARR